MASTTETPPRRESQLVSWSNSFSAWITATPTAVGLVAAQATEYAALNASWVSAYGLVSNKLTRSGANVIAKNIARDLLLAKAKELIGIIQHFPGTTDVERAQLGINIRTPRTPVPVPDKSPIITIKRVDGNIVTLDIAVPGAAGKGKTKGIDDVRLFTFVGTQPDPNPANWHAEGSSSRLRNVKIAFPLDAEPFSKVWITGQFANPRGQCGVASTPVSTNLGTWMVQAVEAEETTPHLKAA